MARRKNADVQTSTDPVDALPGVTLSSVIPAVLSEAVEGYRWEHRQTRADVMKEALTEWAEKRDLLAGARERLSESAEAAPTA